MTQPSLDRQKIAQLEELAELAQVAAEKIWNFNQESQQMAEKWQDWAKKKRQAVNRLEDS
jgi:hypothetical protein